MFVRFSSPELGVYKIQTYDVLASEKEQVNFSEFNNPNMAVILKDLDFCAMSLLLKLLERKAMLIGHLKKLNDSKAEVNSSN